MVADRWTTAVLISVAFLFIALVEGELEMVQMLELESKDFKIDEKIQVLCRVK